MRTMIDKDGNKFQVIEHIMLRNFWEYFVLKARSNTKRIKLCLVLGVEDEMGDVDMEEISPYIFSRTSDFSGVLPASGWSWE